MGLFQKACDTYDVMLPIVPLEDDPDRVPLAPVSHTVKFAGINVIIDASGKFVGAVLRRDKDVKRKDGTVLRADPKIVIPVTEASLGRGSGSDNYPHALCDYLRYMNPDNAVAYGAYVDQLADWAESARLPKLDTILAYVRSGTIMRDLAAAGYPDVDEKTTVCWTVNGLGADRSGPCWTDRELMESFTRYYRERLLADGRRTGLCMVTGKVDVLADGHPKGVVAKYGNAKLVSTKSNTNNQFTYLGRFTDAEQALTIGYEASQKMHNALAWLANNQGGLFDGRVFLCWNPRGIKLPGLAGMLGRKLKAKERVAPSSYRKGLMDVLSGWKSSMPVDADAQLLILDSPTTGCLSVLYYNEMSCSEYLDRFYEWESVCCAGGVAPPLGHFVQYAYGTARNGEYVTRAEVRGQHLQRLVTCRLEGGTFPSDILRRLVENASSLILCSNEGKAGSTPRDKMLRAACAAIYKYRYDVYKEDYHMTPDKLLADRSFIFGQMLAVAERVEGTVLARKGSRRDTAAMRYQRAFSQRPMQTWKQIYEPLYIYFEQLPAAEREGYRSRIKELMNKLPRDGTLNRPLDYFYLLGYSEESARLSVEGVSDDGGATTASDSGDGTDEKEE